MIILYEVEKKVREENRKLEKRLQRDVDNFSSEENDLFIEGAARILNSIACLVNIYGKEDENSNKAKEIYNNIKSCYEEGLRRKRFLNFLEGFPVSFETGVEWVLFIEEKGLDIMRLEPKLVKIIEEISEEELEDSKISRVVRKLSGYLKYKKANVNEIIKSIPTRVLVRAVKPLVEEKLVGYSEVIDEILGRSDGAYEMAYKVEYFGRFITEEDYVAKANKDKKEEEILEDISKLKEAGKNIEKIFTMLDGTKFGGMANRNFDDLRELEIREEIIVSKISEMLIWRMRRDGSMRTLDLWSEIPKERLKKAVERFDKYEIIEKYKALATHLGEDAILEILVNKTRRD